MLVGLQLENINIFPDAHGWRTVEWSVLLYLLRVSSRWGSAAVSYVLLAYLPDRWIAARPQGYVPGQIMRLSRSRAWENAFHPIRTTEISGIFPFREKILKYF